MKQLLKSLTDTRDYSIKLVKNIQKTPVIGLVGRLGAGKTTLVKYMLSALGYKKNVTSPTFLWLKTYPINKHGYKKLHHLDCYRLTDPDEELLATINNCQNDDEAITVIEWADKIKKHLKPEARLLKISPRKNGDRCIETIK